VELPIKCDIGIYKKQLKNNKAVGPDDIPAKAAKTYIDTSVEL